jgi:hypothetical protein
MATATPGAVSSSRVGYRTERTGWTGWIAFAGVMMVLGGALAIFQGIVAIANDTWVVWTNTANVVVDLTQWGWIHLAIGVVAVLAGVGVFTGNVAARMVGVLVAGISLLANFLFLPAYPIWALSIMAVDVLVIWALVVHGGELRDTA